MREKREVLDVKQLFRNKVWNDFCQHKNENLLKPQISEIKAAFFGICVYQFVNENPFVEIKNNILCSEIVQYFYGSDPPSPHFLFVCFFPPFFITITTVLYIFWLLLLLLYTFLFDVVFWLKLLFFMYSFQHFFVILQSFLLVFFCCVVYFPYFPVIKMFFLEFFLMRQSLLTNLYVSLDKKY